MFGRCGRPDAERSRPDKEQAWSFFYRGRLFRPNGPDGYVDLGFPSPGPSNFLGFRRFFSEWRLQKACSGKYAGGRSSSRTERAIKLTVAKRRNSRSRIYRRLVLVFKVRFLLSHIKEYAESGLCIKSGTVKLLIPGSIAPTKLSFTIRTRELGHSDPSTSPLRNKKQDVN